MRYRLNVSDLNVYEKHRIRFIPEMDFSVAIEINESDWNHNDHPQVEIGEKYFPYVLINRESLQIVKLERASDVGVSDYYYSRKLFLPDFTEEFDGIQIS